MRIGRVEARTIITTTNIAQPGYGVLSVHVSDPPPLYGF